MTAKLIERAERQVAATWGKGPTSTAAATLFALALAACGGGGGGADAETPTPPSGATPPSEQPADTGASSGPALTLGQDSFYFVPDASLSDTGALDKVSGGTALFAAWNPNDPNTALKPGMKVMFFGTAQGCASGTEGPLTTLAENRLTDVAALTGLSTAAATTNLRWTPSGNVQGCDSTAKTRDGASAVFLNAASSQGGVALLTTSGVQADGQAAFFGPFGASGQNGAGANAWITGTFVNFRQAWWLADPLQPWAGSSSARLRSSQGMGAVALDAGTGQTVQAKQQLMATFLNATCARELGNSGKPCQIQYLMNTAIARSGVSDWSTVGWFQNGGLSFDPAQGGIPVIDGPIKSSGVATIDAESGLSLFTSQGSATQHSTFKNRTFDVTISFEQLLNVLRMITAKSVNVAPAAVTDSQLAAMWGSEWNRREAWVLLSGDVGQEVYNPDSQRRVEIAGLFYDLFVGPQP